MKRTLRNPPPTFGLQVIEEPQYMRRSPEREDIGEELDESVADSDDDKGLNDYLSESSGDNDYEYEDDFESCGEDSDEGLNDYESDSENDQRNNEPKKDPETAVKFVTIDIGNDIIVLTTEELADVIRGFTTIRWDVYDRNVNLFKNLFSDGLRFASDIFKIVLQSESPHLVDYQLHGNPLSSKRLEFCFKEYTEKYIVFKVPVFRDKLYASHSTVNNLFKFTASIETGGEWVDVDAEYEDGMVSFHCCRVNSFCILTQPKQIPQVVCPSGTKFVTGSKGQVVVHFPEGYVTTKRDITYEVKQPEIIQIGGSEDAWRPKILVAVSDRISLKNAPSIRKPVYFSFPVPDVRSKKKTDIRLIGFKGATPYILNKKPQRIGDEYFYEVKNYNGVALAMIQGPDDLSSSVEEAKQLKLEIDIFYGDRKVCNLLLFLESKSVDTINFIAECVFNKQIESTISKYRESGILLVDKSAILYLYPLQRIRIHVGGCVALLPGTHGAHYFLTFVHASKENSIRFPVKLRVGGVPYAIIDFEADNLERGNLFSVHVEPHDLTRKRMEFKDERRRWPQDFFHLRRSVRLSCDTLNLSKSESNFASPLRHSWDRPPRK